MVVVKEASGGELICHNEPVQLVEPRKAPPVRWTKKVPIFLKAGGAAGSGRDYGNGGIIPRHPGSWRPRSANYLE
jgi:hypothetical protein